MTLGPYQIQLSMGYISSIQERETRRNNQYQDWNDYHEQCQELPDHYEAHLLHLIQEPPNWDNNKFGLFEPCGIIQVRNIPSRMKVQGSMTVVIRYTSQGGNSKFAFLFPALKNILDGCCGPSNDVHCPVGAREVGCCGHVITAINLGFTLAHNPRSFKTTHKPVSLIDIRNQPRGNADRLNLELQRGVTT